MCRVRGVCSSVAAATYIFHLARDGHQCSPPRVELLGGGQADGEQRVGRPQDLEAGICPDQWVSVAILPCCRRLRLTGRVSRPVDRSSKGVPSDLGELGRRRCGDLDGPALPAGVAIRRRSQRPSSVKRPQQRRLTAHGETGGCYSRTVLRLTRKHWLGESESRRTTPGISVDEACAEVRLDLAWNAY